MKRFLFKTKKYFFFILVELLIAFITGIMTFVGLNTSLIKLVVIITNMIVFFIYGYISGKNGNKKGITSGIINALILISILFILSLLIFHKGFFVGTLLYYAVLGVNSIVASIIGKNKKEDATKD